MRRALTALVIGAMLAVGLASPAGAWWGRNRSAPTITSIVAASGDFDRNSRDDDTLLAALHLADTQDGVDLVATLNSNDLDVTVFAPNDRAFMRLARDLGFEGRGEEAAWNFTVGALVGVLGSEAARLSVVTFPLQVRASNGVVHTIDCVLLPVDLTGIIAAS